MHSTATVRRGDARVNPVVAQRDGPQGPGVVRRGRAEWLYRTIRSCPPGVAARLILMAGWTEVFEVSRVLDGRLDCTCSRFTPTAGCEHVRLVEELRLLEGLGD